MKNILVLIKQHLSLKLDCFVEYDLCGFCTFQDLFALTQGMIIQRLNLDENVAGKHYRNGAFDELELEFACFYDCGV